MKVKVSEATPIQLNWMVAKCIYPHGSDEWLSCISTQEHRCTVWSQGGPIIEREKISTNSDYNGAYPPGWVAETYSGGIQQAGPTPLIAAMRCFVVSKLGDEVEIPEELA